LQPVNVPTVCLSPAGAFNKLARSCTFNIFAYQFTYVHCSKLTEICEEYSTCTLYTIIMYFLPLHKGRPRFFCIFEKNFRTVRPPFSCV
jgi:hypothetical protein